ncbi:hypothetical protein AB0D65_16370 [Streptomyces griseoloalbus]|uniref:Uncharacterized protein n=1 Tax=Streptomyces griseoloalbus TaxID=67303 RepID=A0ABV3E5T6_9ACTN
MIWRGGSPGEHRGTDAYRKFMAAQCRRGLQRHAPGRHPGRRRSGLRRGHPRHVLPARITKPPSAA